MERIKGLLSSIIGMIDIFFSVDDEIRKWPNANTQAVITTLQQHKRKNAERSE